MGFKMLLLFTGLLVYACPFAFLLVWVVNRIGLWVFLILPALLWVYAYYIPVGLLHIDKWFE